MGATSARRGLGLAVGVAVAVAIATLRFGWASAPDVASARLADVRADKVMVILVDTVRGDHVSAYGYERETSPVIDAIARDGIRFTRAYAQSNWTKPSVASLFTGLYPRHHGVVIGSAAMNEAGELEKVEKLGAYPMPSDLPLLAETFRENGFETVGFVENSHVNESQGFGRGFDDYRRAVPAERFLRKHLKRRKQDGPIFAYLHLIGPHDPYDNEKGGFDAYRTRFGDPGSNVDFKKLDYKKRNDLEARDIEQAVSLYDAELAYYDQDRLGTLMEWMRESGEYDDWLIVVTSDHGEELYERESWAHGHTLYEEVVRVPMILKLPKDMAGRAAGSAVDEVVELVDLFPTLAEFAGIEVGTEIDGDSLASLIRGEREVDHHAIAISEHATHTREQVLGAAIISRDHKLIEAYDYGSAMPLRLLGSRREALFDLAADPAEDVNRYEAKPSVVASLRDTLHARVGASPAITHRSTGEMVELSDEETEHLRALGYIE